MILLQKFFLTCPYFSTFFNSKVIYFIKCVIIFNKKIIITTNFGFFIIYNLIITITEEWQIFSIGEQWHEQWKKQENLKNK